MDVNSLKAASEISTFFDLMLQPRYVFEKVKPAAEHATEAVQATCTTTFDSAVALNVKLIGGLGSGRWKDRARKTVESYRMLDVNQLSEKGCLRPGWSSRCQWINGDEVASSINLRAESERLHLSYAIRVRGGEWEDVAEVISIVHVPCRFGGSRAYFICPGPGDRTDCGQRVAKLYLSRRYFLCRQCNQLTYASQFERPWQRALRRANKLKQRLGIDVDAESFPDKPEGMWTRTFDGLLNDILQAEILANEAKVNMLKRLAQVKNNGC
jgi:hypothetical protein